MKRIQEFEINDLVKLATEDGDVILEKGERIATIEFDEEVGYDIYEDVALTLLVDLTFEDIKERQAMGEEPDLEDVDLDDVFYSADARKYIDPIIESLKEIVAHVNKAWAGKLTVDEMVALHEDTVFLLAMESLGHGVGTYDETVLTDLMQSRGVEVPDLYYVGNLEMALDDQAWEVISDNMQEGCKDHGKKKKKKKKKEQERTQVATLKTTGGRYEVRVYKDDEYGGYDMEELTSGSSTGMAHGIKTHDAMIAKLVDTIFFSSYIDGIKYKDIESSLRGEVALYFNPDAQFSKLLILAVDDPRVKANRDKVTVVQVEIDYDMIMKTVGDFLQAQGFTEGQIKEVYKKGDKIMVPHKGMTVQGTVVRYDKGGPESPFYVIDVGEYESIKVPTHKVESEVNELRITEGAEDTYAWLEAANGHTVNLIVDQKGHTIFGLIGELTYKPNFFISVNAGPSGFFGADWGRDGINPAILWGDPIGEYILGDGSLLISFPDSINLRIER